MRSIVLVGQLEDQLSYLQKVKTKEKIANYNVVEFNEKVVVDTAREMKRVLSYKISDTEKKIIIVTSEVTQEAQNALLKTLEELPNNADVFFLVRSAESLLPTILSRSNIVVLHAKQEVVTDSSITQVLRDTLLVDALPYPLAVVDQLSDEFTLATIDNVIFSLREILLDEATSPNNSKEHTLRVYVVLQRLQGFYSLLSNNNINIRLTLEQALQTPS